jgi:hypothetical protein
MSTLVIDMAAPPTKRQLELIEAADPRHHQIFPAGTGIATLMAKVAGKKSVAFIQQPSAPALFLSMAYKAHRASKKAETGVKFTDDLMASGLQDGGTFDFFELRIQHVVFSYSALEASKLTAKMLKNDDEAVGDAIDGALLASKPWVKMSKKVQRAGDKLRRTVNYDGWMAYLSLEEIVNARAATEMDVVVRWAFEQGRRRRRP